MTGKTHRVFGIACGMTLFIISAKPEYNPATFGVVLATSYVGSLLPDLDQPAAEIWHTLPFGKTVGKVVDKFLEHRNFSHSLIGTAVFGYLAYLTLKTFPGYWGIDIKMVWHVFLLAYISHLIADMVTVEGVPLLFPYEKFIGFPPKPLDGIRIISGKWFENLVLFPIFNVSLILVFLVFWEKIRTIIYK